MLRPVFFWQPSLRPERDGCSAVLLHRVEAKAGPSSAGRTVPQASC